MIKTLMRTRRLIIPPAFFISVCLLCCINSAQAQTTRSPLPAPAGYVNDYAGVIDSATKDRMETILSNLKQRADIEFAVVTVPTTGDQPIFDYSLAVARGWGIGASEGEKNGLLLLVAINDHKYQMQVSRHLEGDLPDGLVGEIGRRMREPFRGGDYSKGLMNAVQTFVATLSEKRGFSIEGIDQRYAYRGTTAQPHRRDKTAQGLSPCCILFIILIIVLFVLSSRGRGGGGCLNLLLLNALFNAASGQRSSGWSSGGFGGSSGSSNWGSSGGSGFGGFGGGGDFGGGGAGGDW